ncbi:MAG: alpha/beta hydrolase [Bradymonadaceae bacterium]
MKTRRLLQLALSSLAETTWRRLRGQPVADSWPFRFECLLTFVRKRYRHLRAESLETIREAEEAIALDPRGEFSRFATDLDGVDCEWFLADPAAETAPKPGSRAIVYLHGGGYVFGSTNTHADLLTRLTRRLDAPVLGVNYSLCPESSLDDAVDDVISVIRTLVDHGWSPQRLALAGDSAGGGLAVSSAVALRDGAGPLPAALGLLSPWADLRCDGDSYGENADTDYMTREMVAEIAERVCHDRPLDHPVASPVCDDLEDLPPTLIHAGGAEVLLDDARRLSSRLENVGVDVTCRVWPEMVHVFHSFSRVLPPADTALDEFAAFLEDTVEADPSEQVGEPSASKNVA